MGKLKATIDSIAADMTGRDVEPDNEPALVIFGRDESGKAHAATFVAADVELAERAAGFMHFRVARVATPEIRALALELPTGRIFASGRAFVPFAKRPPTRLWKRFLRHIGPRGRLSSNPMSN